MSRQPISVELVLDLENGETTLVRRLSMALIAAIADGRLADGDQLPASRVLASELGLSRSVVVASYEELVASGFLASRTGSGTRVEAGAHRAALAGAYAQAPAPAQTVRSDSTPRPAHRFNLLPGYPDTSLIDPRDWNRAVRAGGRHVRTSTDDVAEIDRGRIHQFDPELRNQLSDHLRRNRGILCDPESVFIFPGVNAAVRTLVGVLMPDQARVGFEEPGYASARRALLSGGARTQPVDVDEDGLIVRALPDHLDAVYVTPAHQFPLGGRLPVGRRAELLEWATAADALVFEDDYDGEFRYGVPPMPALRAMHDGPDRVVYLGTSSKTVARDLRLAWTVVPERFVPLVRERLFDYGDSTSSHSAAVMTEFIRSGAMRRQIASIQRVYSDRRAALSRACDRLLPDFEVIGISAGLHLVLASRSVAFDDVAAVDRLKAEGVACAPLSYYYDRPRPGQRRGLVCGYARLPASQASEAVDLIKKVVTS